MDRRHLPPTTPHADRPVWDEWLASHGIDPRDVAFPGWIERRPSAIAYAAYRLDERGRPFRDPDDPTLDRYGLARLAFTERVVELAGPVAPWPLPEVE